MGGCGLDNMRGGGNAAHAAANFRGGGSSPTTGAFVPVVGPVVSCLSVTSIMANPINRPTLETPPTVRVALYGVSEQLCRLGRLPVAYPTWRFEAGRQRSSTLIHW